MFLVKQRQTGLDNSLENAAILVLSCQFDNYEELDSVEYISYVCKQPEKAEQ